MGGLEPLVEAWTGWETHVLVLLSFVLQVTLVVLADFRRRVKSPVLSSVIWSAYMLADITAVYALGHFSVTGMSAEHELMALWAPLLLVHLGGPDNITAYAVEDNRLWLRHLQSFGLQVVAAAYVLYQSSLFSRPTWLRASAILMLVVGVLKYGERVLALKLASSVPSSALLWFPGVELEGAGKPPTAGKIYRAIQMHLSCMYGVFYSKAEVMCAWHGICIRVISLVFAVAVFLPFHLSSDKDEYNRVDVTATYTLLIGVLVLDVTSVLRLIFSTETIWRLQSCRRPRSWRRSLGRLLESMQEAWIHRLYCSGSMRQLDLFHLRTRMRDSRRSRTVRWMGWWGRWIRLDFSWSTPVTTEIIKILMENGGVQLFPGCEKDIVTLIPEIENIIARHVEVEELLPREKEKKKLEWWRETEIITPKKKLGNRILSWHIATHVLLEKQANAKEPHSPHSHSCVTPSLQGLAKAVKALSNYTFFLLAEHPQLHSDLSCSLLNDPTWMWPGLAPEVRLARLALATGHALGDKLIEKCKDYNKLFEAMAHFWVHVLKTVEETMGEDFHVKQLSNGGEFLTILSILVKAEQPTGPSNQV